MVKVARGVQSRYLKAGYEVLDWARSPKCFWNILCPSFGIWKPLSR
jgi:hypothetical protein